MKNTIVKHRMINWHVCLESEYEFFHIMWKKCFSGFQITSSDAISDNINNIISITYVNDCYVIKNTEFTSNDKFLIFGIAYEIALNSIYLFSECYTYFHGAAMLKNEMLFLILGSTCSGKSTTSALLCMNGYSYLSDDIIPINNETLQVAAFPKPILIRNNNILYDYKNPDEFFKLFDFRIKTLNSYNKIESRSPFYPKYVSSENNSNYYNIQKVFFLERKKNINESLCIPLDLGAAYFELLKNSHNFNTYRDNKKIILSILSNNTIEFYKIQYNTGYEYLNYFI